ncbi:hypothetical protein HMPREF0495_02531 [Levilactobacillus brevis ATCC 14869 = DSM 20054]|uniref:Uncharacterized protein n=1 Tax=Levilactobacillus brevis ATCC 14869 = DSM 20054 TaxID=649758 RepID=U2QIM2_LEVBR|nr:hypothetical protein HMPREF0495_02531 [Levilactobacillus brevis ATCC 14869 = DSM 20054]
MVNGLERTGHDFKPIMVTTAEKLDSVSLKVPSLAENYRSRLMVRRVGM